MSHDVQKSQNAFKTPQSMNGAKEKNQIKVNDRVCQKHILTCDRYPRF